MRKDRIAKSLLAASLLGALVAASPAAVNLTPPAAAQGASRPAQESPAKVSRVRVKADDIARLPRGESYVVNLSPVARKKSAAGNTGLTKAGTGTLEASGGDTNLSKTGTGTLVLSGANTSSVARPDEAGLLVNKAVAHRVYEFRSDRPIDFGRVSVRAGADAAPVPLEAWLRARMPARAMQKWPFKTLVIGPARGVLQVKGWKVGNNPPGTKYECNGETCWCDGGWDCFDLVNSGPCDGDLVCGDDDCFCEVDG